MTVPGFTAEASHRETVGRYIGLSVRSAPQSTIRLQVAEKDYAEDNPEDPTPPTGDTGTGSLLGGGSGDFFASFAEQWMDELAGSPPLGLLFQRVQCKKNCNFTYQVDSFDCMND